jgi:Ras-related protein Rab-21
LYWEKVSKLNVFFPFFFFFFFFFHSSHLAFFTIGCVGKTSLTIRYCQDKFNASHITTIQASFLVKRLNVDAQRVQLNIWDTAGQERFHALGPIYYRDADGALLVYDITSHDSFSKVQNWVKELRKMLGKQIAIVIAGNKCDLQRERAVSLEEATRYAQSVGAQHFETSAKLNKGLDEMFVALTRSLLTQSKPATSGAGSGAGRGGRGTLVITNEPSAAAKQAERSSCCG